MDIHAFKNLPLEEQTEEVCISIVRLDGDNLFWVRNQTETICKEAVMQSGYALEHVHDQTLEICRLALTNKIAACSHVSNRFKKEINKEFNLN